MSPARCSGWYVKSAIKFGLEAVGAEEILSIKPARERVQGSFYDGIAGKTITTIVTASLSPEEQAYVNLNNTIDTNTNPFSVNVAENSITFFIRRNSLQSL